MEQVTLPAGQVWRPKQFSEEGRWPQALVTPQGPQSEAPCAQQLRRQDSGLPGPCSLLTGQCDLRGLQGKCIGDLLGDPQKASGERDTDPSGP